MTEQALPHSLEAEQAVLGAMLTSVDAIDAALEQLAPQDFYRHAHQVLFRRLSALHAHRQPIDTLTLVEALRAANELEDCNGPAYVASLTDGVPRSTNVGAYARIVRQKATLRELADVSRQTLAAALAGQDDAASVLDAAQQRFFEIAVERTTGGFVPVPEVVDREVWPLLERLVERKQAISGVPTGLLDLDLLTRGLQPADLVIVAARPSMGKTALALNAAFHAALVGDYHVGVFSLEMKRADLVLRAVIAEGRLNGMRVRSGQLSEADFGRLSQAVGTVAAARVHIDDSASLTVNDIRARARRMKAQVGLDLLIIDYLQLIRPTGRSENRAVAVAEISRALKGIAKDLDVPVVALSQLSRACESRPDKRPQMSDLRESGAIEQDADIVLFLYRDEVYHDDTADRGIAELILSKQRNGPTGTVKVGFNKHETRFFNLHDTKGAVA